MNEVLTLLVTRARSILNCRRCRPPPPPARTDRASCHCRRTIFADGGQTVVYSLGRTALTVVAVVGTLDAEGPRKGMEYGFHRVLEPVGVVPQGRVARGFPPGIAAAHRRTGRAPRIPGNQTTFDRTIGKSPCGVPSISSKSTTSRPRSSSGTLRRSRSVSLSLSPAKYI